MIVVDSGHETVTVVWPADTENGYASRTVVMTNAEAREIARSLVAAAGDGFEGTKKGTK